MMKKSIVFLTACALIFLGCSDDDSSDIPVVNQPESEGPIEEIPQDPERVDFELASVNDSGIGGIAAFIPEDDGTTTVYIELTGTSQELHPASINFGDTESGGTAAITLKACECRISTTKVTQYDNGIAVDFAELMSFDGHLNIYQSPDDNAIVAHANIGSNAF
jgi:hypothetical protein